MPKYLFQVNYSTVGIEGLLKEGGTHRREYIKGLLESVGGKLESFYFMWGEDDVIAIAEFPDQTTAVGVALNLGASGAVNIRTTPLLEPDEIDAATQLELHYRPPG